MNDGKKIVVTWDFTDKAYNALAHAKKMAKILENTIVLLHIVKTTKQLNKSEQKLKEIAAKIKADSGIKVEIVIKEGSIFTTIGEYTEENEEDINLVIMGTHGIQGLQKITGSWALKVIVSSHAPFIVVQDPPTDRISFDKIVFPISFKSENREKLVWAIYFGKIFNATIHFIKQEVTDKNLVRKVQHNLAFAKKYLTKYNVSFEIDTASATGDFSKATVDFAKNIDADLMLIMTTKNIGALDYVFGANEQYIISNTAKIPVMCVNPRKTNKFSLATF